MIMPNNNQVTLNNDFVPPIGLRNPHLQTILSSMGPRQIKLGKYAESIKSKQQDMILECGDGVRLAGALNIAGDTPSERLAILIHGWEGCFTSNYIISMTNALLVQGIDVFRLNMRDHGATHHLNEKIFNSTLIISKWQGCEFKKCDCILSCYSCQRK